MTNDGQGLPVVGETYPHGHGFFSGIILLDLDHGVGELLEQHDDSLESDENSRVDRTRFSRLVTARTASPVLIVQDRVGKRAPALTTIGSHLFPPSLKHLR